MGRLRRACAPLLLSAALVGAMLVSSGPASATLNLLKPAPATPATFVGHGGYSADGLGQDNTTGGTVQAEVPAGSTVVQAYLYGTYFGDADTRPRPTAPSTSTARASCSTSSPTPSPATPVCRRRAATSPRRSRPRSGAGGGITDFAVNTDPPNLDGVALVVIYSNPASPEVTVAVLDGGSKQLGDQTTLNFAAPHQPGGSRLLGDHVARHRVQRPGGRRPRLRWRSVLDRHA